MKNFNVFSDKDEMKTIAFAFVLLFFAFAALAQETGTAPLLGTEVLEKTLYAKNSEEKAYCAYIIQQRDNGVLPMKIFYGVYYRAAEKEKARRFIYFRTGIEILCQREGVVLPAFSVVETQKKTGFLWTNTTSKPAVEKNGAASFSIKKPFSFIYSWFKR